MTTPHSPSRSLLPNLGRNGSESPRCSFPLTCSYKHGFSYSQTSSSSVCISQSPSLIHSPFYFSVYTAPALFACRKQQRQVVSVLLITSHTPDIDTAICAHRHNASFDSSSKAVCPSNASSLPAKDHADLTLTQKTSHKRDNAIVPHDHFDTTERIIEWIITTNYHQYISPLYTQKFLTGFGFVCVYTNKIFANVQPERERERASDMNHCI